MKKQKKALKKATKPSIKIRDLKPPKDPKGGDFADHIAIKRGYGF